ncbi:MAG TPA: DUF5683 domain-containing protein [Longimicrobiales bacterium]|nr:DUF5683 domain-containing protein [Longimicrobiales bacterium]
MLLRNRREIGTLGMICALGVLALPGRLQAQVSTPTAPAEDTVTVQASGVSPRGAFLRAAAIPGWGHASIGSYKRAGFYFFTEGATAWSLVKTRRRVAEAEERVRFREGIVRADLAAEGVTDPEEIQTRLDDDKVLQDLLALEEARRQQREDWTALAIFLLFLSGADAYVSAHLKDFPAPIQVNVEPVGNGRIDLSVGVKLPR